MTIDEIKELIQLVLDTGIAELEVGRGEDRVRIRRTEEAREVLIPAASGPTPPGAPQHNPAPAPVVEDNATYVKAPIVGTFYEAPSPEADPFVKVGDRVAPGQVLCIIESMKLMNEIESEVAGTVTSKLVENGKPVEYGEALFAIRPD